jgi:signal transduction histidine kinase
MNQDTNAQLAAEHEALIQFLYLAPVGLVQTGIDGEIQMINPISAQLLMPLARDGNLANLFDTLQDVAPELRQLVSTFGRASGMVCDGLQIHLQPSGMRARRAPEVLSLTLLKLDGERLMAVLHDVTEQVRRNRDQRWSPELDAATDHATEVRDANR